jgi:hypothetical protein
MNGVYDQSSPQMGSILSKFKRLFKLFYVLYHVNMTVLFELKTPSVYRYHMIHSN